MSRALSILILLISFVPSSCCPKNKRVEPPYPTNVVGWKESEQNGVHYLGEFVLKKGEATKNSKVEIRALEFLPPEACREAGEFQGLARVKLQFIQTSNNLVLCEKEFGETQSGVFPKECGENLGITAIGIRAINLKDEWVFFNLTK
jgi:hypothetical protein